MRTLYSTALSATLVAWLLACTAAAQTRFDTIYSFADGVAPSGLTLVRGVLYGTSSGLAAGTQCGQVFQLNPPAAAGDPWTWTVLYSFPGYPGIPDANGCEPNYGPATSADGALYGITYYGGQYGYGVFYQLSPPASLGGAWTESALYSFVIPPIAPLVPGPGGSFYELTDPGLFDAGSILRMQPPSEPGAQWTFTTLCSFPANSFGAAGGPTSILPAPGGRFYGTVTSTPSDTAGEVIGIAAPAAPGGTCGETVLYAFGANGSDVAFPGPLIRADDGTLYGTAGNASAAFQLTPPASAGGAWAYTLLKTFGYYLSFEPLLLRNGNLYGALQPYYDIVTPTGIIFALKPPTAPGGDWTLAYLHQFTNGQLPVGPLVMDPAGAIYGTTVATGTTEPSGTIYRIVP